MSFVPDYNITVIWSALICGVYLNQQWFFCLIYYMPKIPVSLDTSGLLGDILILKKKSYLVSSYDSQYINTENM